MKKPRILAVAEFSRDMVETLLRHFSTYSVEGVVSVEVTDKGLWLRNPDGTRQFLGSVRDLREDWDAPLQ